MMRVSRSVKRRLIEIYKLVVEEKDLMDINMEMLYFLKRKQDGLFELDNYRIDKEFKKLKDINFGFTKGVKE